MLGNLPPSKGSSSKCTSPSIRLAGSLSGHTCSYFVDSGSTGDFVSTQFVLRNKLGRQCTSLPAPLTVSLADGKVYTTSTVLKAARLGGENPVLQGSLDLAVLSLEGYDVILGMPWLKETNPDINWETGDYNTNNPALIWWRGTVRMRDDAIGRSPGLGSNGDYMIATWDLDGKLYYTTALVP